jgi:hypothetical protein
LQEPVAVLWQERECVKPQEQRHDGNGETSVMQKLEEPSQISQRSMITDRRRQRALSASPVSEISGASKPERTVAVRVHPMVR